MDLSFLQENDWQDRPYPLAEAIQVQQGNKVQLITSRAALYRLLSEGALIVQEPAPEPETVAPEVVETPAPIEEVQEVGQALEADTQGHEAQPEQPTGGQTEASEPAVEAQASE